MNKEKSIEKRTKNIFHYSKEKLLKTIGYRLSASGIAQLAGWLLFHRLEVNIGVLIADVVQMVWYWSYESMWDNFK